MKDKRGERVGLDEMETMWAYGWLGQEEKSSKQGSGPQRGLVASRVRGFLVCGVRNDLGNRNEDKVERPEVSGTENGMDE